MPINEFIIKQDITHDQLGEWTTWSHSLGWTIRHYGMGSSISTDSKRKWLDAVAGWLNDNRTGRWTGSADLDLSQVELNFENSGDVDSFEAALKDDEIY